MKTDAIVTWPLRVRIPEGLETEVPLWASTAAATLRVEGDTLWFDVPDGQHVYLSSSKHARFAQPPDQTALSLQPGSPYRLRGAFSLEGGQVTLWLIEYDASARLSHWARPLRDGGLEVSWTADSRHASCCLALRLSGTGRLRCVSLELTRPAEDQALKTGPRGGFRAPSIFFDPCGYKPYVEKHHRFYDQRRPDWYERVARPFAECSSVLEFGCGPGLLLEALGDAGVQHAFGLERDSVYLEACRARGLTAIQHDLNEPFPFVESASVDGVVSHSSFDYLAPIAARTTLRECLRVLKPGGLLRIAARLDGQASGDEARCSVPLTPELLHRLLREAGFDQIEVSVSERAIEAAARRPADHRMWSTRSVVLKGGHGVRPWSGGRTMVRGDRLIAEPGAVDEPHALTRTVPLDKETQCTLRLAPESAGRGTILLSLEGQGHQHEILIHGDGHCTRAGESLTSAGPPGNATAACLRIVLPPDARPETVLTVWHGERREAELHETLNFTPETLRIRIKVPLGEPPSIVDHLDVWQPLPVQVEAFGDAHMYMGVCRTGDDLLPDIDRAAFRAALRKHEIGRALVTTYGSTPQLDSFDQISPLAKELRGCMYPLIRLRSRTNATGDEKQFQINQLEVLWQKGLLAGLKVKLNASETPEPEALQWAERRQVLTMWHVSSAADLEWLSKQVLKHYSFPVLLSHFGGDPLDRNRYRACIALLDRYPQLYLVTSLVFFTDYLEEAIRHHADRVLLGSDFPGVDPSVARAAILALDVPETSKILVLSENLRFLTERVAWCRWKTLRERQDLLFPPLPESPEEAAAQGFQIVPPREMPEDESRQAREFWSGSRVSSFYLEHKPWATLIAQLARDLGARSALEFGCHVGRNLAAVRDANPDIRVVGLDINEAAVRAGREQSGLELRVGDQTTLSGFRDSEFDLVFTVSVLDHIPAIAEVCRELIRVAARNVFFLEVTLPLEGKVVRHFDHKRGGVYPSTEASYSWFVDRYIADHPRVWRLDCRPCYLHSSSLGPFYWSYLAFLEEPRPQESEQRTD